MNERKEKKIVPSKAWNKFYKCLNTKSKQQQKNPQIKLKMNIKLQISLQKEKAEEMKCKM